MASIPTHDRRREEHASDFEMANAEEAFLESSLNFPFRVACGENAASAFEHGNYALRDALLDQRIRLWAFPWVLKTFHVNLPGCTAQRKRQSASSDDSHATSSQKRDL